MARALTKEGLLWLDQNDSVQAIQRIKTALDYAPNDVSVQIALAKALQRSSTPKAAEAIINGLPSDLAQQAWITLHEPD
ncbi:tetratricopeptide repeat protein [Nonomuraea salmonea]|uniref:tetratricopeptide repeat protein n=1 Tax=Nonomuraea salmonea TaxID=46181 RepID=UPI0031ED9EB4